VAQYRPSVFKLAQGLLSCSQQTHCSLLLDYCSAHRVDRPNIADKVSQQSAAPRCTDRVEKFAKAHGVFSKISRNGAAIFIQILYIWSYITDDKTKNKYIESSALRKHGRLTCAPCRHGLLYSHRCTHQLPKAQTQSYPPAPPTRSQYPSTSPP
jgi:hypothetical protein